MALQARVGWRANTPSLVSTLLTSLYGVWNGDALGTSLDTSIYRVYNGNNVNDSSGNAQNGTNVGSVTFTTGKVGNAFTFNGSNYIGLPNNSLNLTSDFSVSLWANFTSVGSGVNTTLIDSTCFGNNTSPQEGTSGWRLYYFNGFLYFDNVNDNSNVQLSTNAINTANTWYHITVTLTSGSTIIYVNGTPIVSNTATQRPNYRKTVGPAIGANRSGSNRFNGKIDSVTVWSKRLTSVEVLGLYNVGNGAEYPFSSQILPSPNDAVGSNNGTLTNGASFTTGKIGTAFVFDGVNDYVALPNNSINVTGDFSISGWVYIPSGYLGANQIFILDNISANAWYNNPNGYALSTYGNSIKFDILNNTNTYYTLTYATGGGGFTTNAWYHIVATRKASVGSKIYLNGSLVASDTNTVNPTYLATVSKPCIGALDIPARGSVAYFAPANSRIDAVSLWTKELSAADVTELYNSGNGKQYPNF
jgi:hypothetical protein